VIGFSSSPRKNQAHSQGLRQTASPSPNLAPTPRRALRLLPRVLSFLLLAHLSLSPGSIAADPASQASPKAAPTHWAFQPLTQPKAPIPLSPEVPTAIDAFLLDSRSNSNVTPGIPSPTAPPADRRTLLRRITYDLTGLPPTPEDMDRFLADPSPNAFKTVVDRLLASPAYGERWGRKWLDLVRYADTAGENSDHPAPHAWRYRNWVIDAFNRDLPYDQFVRLQIAGDLIEADATPERYAEGIIATGYLAVARRFGHDTDKDMHLTYEDVLDTLGKSVLGLTLGCARCHDHKYDPVPARDYYALYGILASTRFAFPGCEPKQQPRDLVPLVPPAEAEARLKPWRDDLARLDAELKQLDATIAAQQPPTDSPAPGTVTLGAGDLPPGGSVEFRSGQPRFPRSWLRVKPGDMVQLTVLPRGNYGADATGVELTLLEPANTNRSWSLTRDVIDDFHANGEGARHSDRLGHRGVWNFFDPQPFPTLFTEFVRDAEKTPGLQVWRGPSPNPSVFVNTRTETIHWATISMPPRSFGVHPGPNGPVALAWESPVETEIIAELRLAKIDPGGDGVGWKLELRPGFGPALEASRKPLLARRELQRQRDELAAREPRLDVAYAVTEGTPSDARLQKRGDPEQPGDPVPRGNLQLLGGQHLHNPKSSGRLELADWLTSRTNPLTARVIANRVWQGHFGEGLVPTPNDFGTRGTRPTHPELLDYLAGTLIQSGWSLKGLHREMVLSAAYQRASSHPQAATTTTTSPTSSPGSETSLFPRRRLEAEEIRDTLLALTGELDPTPGGPHPFPPEKGWSFTQHTPFKAVYDSNRRSVYLMTQRIQRHPFLALFDGPDANASTPRRENSTVPTQALYFLNDPFFHARSEAFAKRLLGLPEDQRIAAAHRWCFQRPPTSHEEEGARRFLDRYQQIAAEAQAAPSDLAAWSAYSRSLLASSELLHLD
jgi:hypothetical protein